MIKNRKELLAFEFSSLPESDFVIKPNHGSKGRGIFIIHREGACLHQNSQSDNEIFFHTGGKTRNEAALKNQLAGILDGEYSLTNDDSMLIEEKLIPGADFKLFCTHGLADIRIIVFNLVPVAAEIRIPTEKSGGKANFAAGGIGCGIDIQTGKIFSSFIQGRLYKQHFPSESKEYQNKKLPFRDDVLFLSSKIQYFVNL
jgi:hypothetical protein